MSELVKLPKDQFQFMIKQLVGSEPIRTKIYFSNFLKLARVELLFNIFVYKPKVDLISKTIKLDFLLENWPTRRVTFYGEIHDCKCVDHSTTKLREEKKEDD